MRLSISLLSLLAPPTLGICMVLFSPAPAQGDIVHLKDGTRLEGEVRRAEGAWVITDTDGTVTEVEASAVVSIEMGKRGEVTDDVAGMRLASLKRSVESIGDLRDVIQRYERFIEQHPGTPAAKIAADELVAWRQRQQQGLVKYGDAWVTPQQRDEIEERAFMAANEARDLLAQGQFRQAEELVEQILADDPANPAAMFMRGILLYGREQIPAARKAFDTLNAAMPNYAPTLNNLAVVLWKQNQHVAALNFYEQAMQVSPLNPVIIDNLAEAIAGLPEKYQNNATVRNVVDRFKVQDAQLQQRMAESGWYRWGATWVDKTQFDRIQEAEREVRKVLATLVEEFNNKRKEIDEIDRDIDENKRAMRQLEASRYYRDRDGNLIKGPLPPMYDEIREDNELLLEQRDRTGRKIEALRAEARRVERQLPQPTFTGSQRLIGIEGIPLAPADAPTSATQPSDEPATMPAVPATRPADAESLLRLGPMIPQIDRPSTQPTTMPGP